MSRTTIGSAVVAGSVTDSHVRSDVGTPEADWLDMVERRNGKRNALPANAAETPIAFIYLPQRNPFGRASFQADTAALSIFVHRCRIPALPAAAIEAHQFRMTQSPPYTSFGFLLSSRLVPFTFANTFLRLAILWPFAALLAFTNSVGTPPLSTDTPSLLNMSGGPCSRPCQHKRALTSVPRSIVTALAEAVATFGGYKSLTAGRTVSGNKLGGHLNLHSGVTLRDGWRRRRSTSMSSLSGLAA